MMLHLVTSIVVAYLLGSISGSLLLGRLKGVDIRKQGSGNAGGTNAFRTQGARFALGVVAIDLGKGFVAAKWLPGWIAALGIAPGTDLTIAAMAGGFAATLGHVYPLYHGFRGGKGAGTLAGALLALLPWAALPVIAVWIVVLILSGYVGLSTMVAAASFVPIAALLAPASQQPLWLGFALLCAGFIVFTHRSNIQRLRDGTENRFEKVRLFRRRRASV
jgi:glycerol-3-phosphate acyltransferase PlsY